MKRRIFHFLSLVSLVMTLGFGVMWMRSVDHYDRASWNLDQPMLSPHIQRFYYVVSVDSECGLGYTYAKATNVQSIGSFKDLGLWRSHALNWDTDDMARNGRYFSLDHEGAHPLGFDVGSHQYSYRGLQIWDWWIDVPYWFPLALCLILPLLWLVRHIRLHRRRVRGLCWRCGYDLRMTPDRCPECGWPFPPAG